MIQLAISEVVLDEAARVLRDKFEWSADAVLAARLQISLFTDHVIPERRIDAVKDDPDDNRILECAVTANSEYLVTGDKHLLRLARFGRTKIIAPAEFLRIFAEDIRSD